MVDRSTGANTIGDLIEGSYTLTAWCRRCKYKTELDLDLLRDRLGPGHSTLNADLAPKLRCSRCGARGPSSTLTPPYTFRGEYPR